ncbi:unnamed protein product [Aureobasidium vineae]|uniref:Uncharacterized protein n=1 Tax=Aureobasidium vineae TaxID=2773715 RepID=A0A9N8JIR0_9PEZI|nr:unnamed protein product [Aureobasidium vineae]
MDSGNPSLLDKATPTHIAYVIGQWHCHKKQLGSTHGHADYLGASYGRGYTDRHGAFDGYCYLAKILTCICSVSAEDLEGAKDLKIRPEQWELLPSFAMPDLDAIALEGASTFLRLLVQALNVVLDPGSYAGELAFHRVSPLECLYDLTARLVGIVHFLLYNGRDVDSGIVLFVAEDYLPPRLALNIPSIYHAYKIFRLSEAYWTKVFAASYLLCWLSAKIYPMRSQQPTVAENDRVRRKITNPVFFALTHSLVCFAVFNDRLEAALWSWFGILAIAGFTLAISPTPPRINPPRDPEFEVVLQLCCHLACLAVCWLFGFSHISLDLKVKDKNWRDSRALMVMTVLQLDAAMIFLVVARAERWSILRFGLVGASLIGMAYVHYIEMYALIGGTKALLN